MYTLSYTLRKEYSVYTVASMARHSCFLHRITSQKGRHQREKVEAVPVHAIRQYVNSLTWALNGTEW